MCNTAEKEVNMESLASVSQLESSKVHDAESSSVCVDGPVVSEKACDREPWEDDRVTAFLCVFGSVLCWACTVGFHATYGIWLTGYKQQFPSASFQILSLIGNLMVAVSEITVYVAGLSVDAYGARSCMWVGAVLIVLGYVLLAQASEIWHAMLAQGVLVGAGLGLVSLPALMVPIQWFERRKWLVFSVIQCGTSLGGAQWTLLLPAVEDLGAWKNRIVALVVAVELTIGIALIKSPPALQRQPFDFKKFIPNFKLLKNKSFVLILVGQSLGQGACWPFTVFGPTLLDRVASQRIRSVYWVIAQITGIIGRLTAGYFSDNRGVLDMYCLCCLCLFCVGVGTWLPISDNGTALAFCVLFGLTSGGFAMLADAAPVRIVPVDGSSALGLTVLFGFPLILTSPVVGALAIEDTAKRPFLKPGLVWCSLLAVLLVCTVAARHCFSSNWRKRV